MVLLESSRDNRVQGINEIVLINDLNQQGLSVLAIAQQVGYDRKTVKKYIERSLEARYEGLIRGVESLFYVFNRTGCGVC